MLSKKLRETLNETDEDYAFWESLGFHNVGQHEWRRGDWTVEYMGTKGRLDRWRIDDYADDGHQILFIDLVTFDDLEWVLSRV